MRETELKFAVHPFFELPEWDESSGVASQEELPVLDLRATYHDTDDLRLARWGVTLRHRTGEDGEEGWDLKLPGRGAGLTRDERHVNGPPETAPGDLVDLLTAFVRTAPLRPVATLGTRRRRWSLRDADGQELAVLFDDEVSVMDGRRVTARFREIEVEQREADDQGLERIGLRIRSAGAGPHEPVPKVVRALGPRATAAPDLAPRDRIDPAEPAVVAIRSALAAGAERIVRYDPVARLGEDPEGVHQVRVGARRLRGDLRTFAPLLDAEWAAPLADELGWLRRALGDVRDIDVQVELLKGRAGNLRVPLRPL